MKLTFSILWFDDNEEWLESLDIEDLETEIKNWGFVPNIVRVSSDKDFNNHQPFKQFDLIVVDYRLDDFGHGETFISSIRSNQIFTEVIFYSNHEATSLWEAIFQNRLEGVYVETRNSVKTKIIQVGSQVVSKVLDLENMRGIVMAEVGDLDILLDEILRRGIETLPEDKKKAYFDSFIEGLRRGNQKTIQEHDAFANAPGIEAFLRFCDSDKRWQGINRLIKHHPALKGIHKREYTRELLFPRNCLGHGIPTPCEGGGLTFSHRDNDYHFDDDVGKELRMKIMEYKAYLSEIQNKLQ